jgi:hypothetical protein
MKSTKFQCAATIQCAREHFSYCAAAHPRSLEGTLTRRRIPEDFNLYQQ